MFTNFQIRIIIYNRHRDRVLFVDSLSFRVASPHLSSSMVVAEPKSGRLYKYGQGLLGSKWTEKWVHLDGTVLKYFSMASEQQPLFSLTSTRQSCVVDLAAYDVVQADDKRLNRKHAFQLIPRNKTSKSYVFACSNESEFREWMDAFKARNSHGVVENNGTSALVAEKLRRAAEAFAACDLRRTDKIDASKLRVLLQSLFHVGWQGSVSEYSMLQQQLDPNVDGKIARDTFLRVMKQHFNRRESLASENESISKVSDDCASPRSSIDQRSITKSQACTEPDADVPDCDSVRDSLREASVHQPDLCNQYQNQPHKNTDFESHRNWHTEYTELLKKPNSDCPEDVIRRGLELTELLSAFRATAEETVVRIIDRLLSGEVDCGSYSQLSLNGDQFLGTDDSKAYEDIRDHITKYSSSGLLIYLTHDETASVIFGHEIRGARVLHEALRATQSASQSMRIDLPLQCVVDYMGFRAFVLSHQSSDLHHIQSSRMLAGCDEKASQDMLATLERAFTQVGIFTGTVSTDDPSSGARLPEYVGADTGVEMTSKRSFTLHNVLSIMPSDPVHSARAHGQFRPEFVLEYGTDIPMLPSPHQTGCGILNEAGDIASEYLQSVLIPRFMVNLEAHSSQMYDSATFTAALHQAGINMRYLALCYNHALSKHTRRFILSEVIARTVKRLLRRALRDFYASSHVVNQRNEITGPLLPAINCVVPELFNLVFNVRSADSKFYWSNTIIPLAVSVFNIPRVLLESFPDEFNDEQLHWPQLLLAVLHHTNITVTEMDERKLGSSNPFTPFTQISWSPRVTMLCRTTPECEVLISSGGHTADERHIDTILAHLTIASLTPFDERTPSLALLHLRASEIYIALKELNQADTMIKLAVEAAGPHCATRVWVQMGQIMIMKEQGKPINEMMHTFDEAVATATWHLGKSHPLLHSLYLKMAEVARGTGGFEESSHCFTAAAEMIKDCYGRSSLQYADTRRHHAELLIQQGAMLDHASIMLDEAFTIYDEAVRTSHEDPMSIRALKSSAAACLYMLAHLQSLSDDKLLDTAYSTAIRAHAMRVDALPAGHYEILSSSLQLGDISRALGDSYRALEFYRSSLMMLKAMASTGGQDISTQVQRISHIVVHLHLQTLGPEKLTIIEKTRQRFSDLFLRLEAAASVVLDGVSSVEEPGSRLLAHAVRLLLQKDPVDYCNELLESTDREMHVLRRQSFALATLRRDSASSEAPASPSRASPLSPPLSSSSRFASFAYGQPPQLTPRPASPLPPSHRSGLDSPAPRLLPSSDRSVAFLTTDTGEFTSSAQLATVLFLVHQV